MKRFAVLAVFLGGPAFAGDAPAGPTSPQVPPPVIHNGLPTNQPVFDSGPKPFAHTSLSRLVKNPVTDSPVLQTSEHLPHPLPLPTGLASVPYGPTGCASPAGCAVTTRGSCWDKFKKWMCYAPCDPGAPRPVPTPCYAPHYSYFLCKESAGNVGGCAGGNCAPGRTLIARGPKEKCGPACDPLTGPVDAGMPGFRFAAPETPAVGGAPAGPVVSTAFKMPSYGSKPPPR